MTQDEVIALAREAGLFEVAYPNPSNMKEVKRFAAAIEFKLKADLLAGAGEPTAYLAWRDGKPCYEGDDAVCEDAVWPVDGDDDRASMAVYTADQVAAAVLRESRKPLERKDLVRIELGLRKYHDGDRYDLSLHDFARAIEAAHHITRGAA